MPIEFMQKLYYYLMLKVKYSLYVQNLNSITYDICKI